MLCFALFLLSYVTAISCCVVGLLAAQSWGRGGGGVGHGESWWSITMGHGRLSPTRKPAPEQCVPLPLSVYQETLSCKSWKSQKSIKSISFSILKYKS